VLTYRENEKFRNQHGTVVVTAPRIGVPKNDAAPQPWKTGLAALKQLVQDAKAANTSLCPLGAAWSLSGVVNPPGWLVETKHLNEIPAVGLPPQYVEAASGVDPARLAFVQGGNTVARLHLELARLGRSLRASGASCGQTIAGAFSTGTHGSAFDVGAIHDTIVGLHVVGEDGRVYWIERADRRVASQAFLAELGAEPKPSNALFEAALVSFGSFGLVHGVLLDTDPLFLLKRHRTRHDLRKLLAGISLGPAGFTVPATALPRGRDGLYHFDILMNPNDVLDEGAIVQTLYRAGNVVDYHYDDKAARNLGVGDDVLGFTSTLMERLGKLINPSVRHQVKKLENLRYPMTGDRPEVGVLGEMFPRTEFRAGGDSCEIGVDVANARPAVDACLQAIGDLGVAYPGFIGVRFVKGSKATLAFTRFPVTCTIEMPILRSKKTAGLFANVFARLRQRQIPFTLHWGQAGDFTPASVQAMYGAAAVGAWRAERLGLLGAGGLARFRSRLLESSGLA